MNYQERGSIKKVQLFKNYTRLNVHYCIPCEYFSHIQYVMNQSTQMNYV